MGGAQGPAEARTTWPELDKLRKSLAGRMIRNSTEVSDGSKPFRLVPNGSVSFRLVPFRSQRFHGVPLGCGSGRSGLDAVAGRGVVAALRCADHGTRLGRGGGQDVVAALRCANHGTLAAQPRHLGGATTAPWQPRLPENPVGHQTGLAKFHDNPTEIIKLSQCFCNDAVTDSINEAVSHEI